MKFHYLLPFVPLLISCNNLVATDVPDTGPVIQNKTTVTGCNNMEKIITTGIERLNNCETDSDCTVFELSACPFGCFYYYNKNLSFEETATAMQKFATMCSRCVYSCTEPPTADQLICEAGKCVLPE